MKLFEYENAICRRIDIGSKEYVRLTKEYIKNVDWWKDKLLGVGFDEGHWNKIEEKLKNKTYIAIYQVPFLNASHRQFVVNKGEESPKANLKIKYDMLEYGRYGEISPPKNGCAMLIKTKKDLKQMIGYSILHFNGDLPEDKYDFKINSKKAVCESSCAGLLSVVFAKVFGGITVFSYAAVAVAAFGLLTYRGGRKLVGYIRKRKCFNKVAQELEKEKKQIQEKKQSEKEQQTQEKQLEKIQPLYPIYKYMDMKKIF